MPRYQKRRKPAPKKRGPKPKAEREQWLKDKQAEEEARPIYEKEIVHQLSESVETLFKEAPLAPQWGVKKNSDGKNVFWFGYKAHLAVSTKSQYIIAGLMTSGNLNDGKAAIPLLKKIEQDLPARFTAGLFDAGYDYAPIYQQLSNQNLQAVIPYNRRNEGEVIGFDEHFAPTCVLEHSYRYDSFDLKYKSPNIHARKNVEPVHYKMIHFVKRPLKLGNPRIYGSILSQLEVQKNGMNFTKDVPQWNE